MSTPFILGLILGTFSAILLCAHSREKWIKQGFAYARNEEERRRMGWTKEKWSLATLMGPILGLLVVAFLRFFHLLAPGVGLKDFAGLLAVGIALSFFVILSPIVFVYDRRLRNKRVPEHEA